MVNKTTMTFIGYGKWRCDSCGTEYSGYTTRCIDWCKKENITDGKSNLIKNESQSTKNTQRPAFQELL